MFKETYSLLLEILADEEINQYVSKYVGKKLTVINAGAQVTSPSATITLNKLLFLELRAVVKLCTL